MTDNNNYDYEEEKRKIKKIFARARGEINSDSDSEQEINDEDCDLTKIFADDDEITGDMNSKENRKKMRVKQKKLMRYFQIQEEQKELRRVANSILNGKDPYRKKTIQELNEEYIAKNNGWYRNPEYIRAKNRRPPIPKECFYFGPDGKPFTIRFIWNLKKRDTMKEAYENMKRLERQLEAFNSFLPPNFFDKND